MSLLDALRHRLRPLLRRDDFDREMDEEFRHHAAMHAQEFSDGNTSSDRAYGRFGSRAYYMEETRRMTLLRWLDPLAQDLRYSWRALRRTPAFTIVAVVTVALAIGANSAVFTVVNSVLLQPLPFSNASQIYGIAYSVPGSLFGFAVDDRLFSEFRLHASRFEGMTGYETNDETLTGQGDAARISGANVSASFFDVLGVHPVLGRGFLTGEDRPGNDPVVVLSERLWRSRFNSDRTVVGRTITLNGISRTIVGVMPSGFTFPDASEFWTPLTIGPDLGGHFFAVAGRLRGGATPAQARAELESIARAQRPDPRVRRAPTAAEPVAQVTPLKDRIVGAERTSLLILAGAVAFVLLIACANVANLLLIRAATRRHEIAVRISLGATRGRLARQLLTESLLIALIGGAASIVVAFAGVRALVALAPSGRIPRITEVHLNGSVFAFTLVVSLITGVLFGLVPARSGAGREPHEALGSGTRLVGGAHRRLRAVFVTGQMALALILLTGAGLMIKSFLMMRSVNTGYDASHVVTMSVDLPQIAYPDATRLRAFHTAVLDRLAALPGITAVGAVSFRPMAEVGIMGDFVMEGEAKRPEGFVVDKPTVSPGYFGAMGIRLLAGRDFAAADRMGAPGVVIVSATVAERLWPNQSAIGKRLSMRGPEEWLTVVGVVNDVVQDGQLAPHSTMYLPYLQTTDRFFMNQMTFVLRGGRGTANLAPAMRAALRDVDPAVPAQSLQTMDQSMMQMIAEPVFQMRLLATFAALALLLAALGTYGVLTYDVTERTREIGLRIALGATPRSVLQMVLRRTAGLAIIGASLGLVGSLALTSVLSKSLFEVKPTDPVTLVLVTIGLMLVALIAGYIPAQRATRISALTALMHE